MVENFPKLEDFIICKRNNQKFRISFSIIRALFNKKFFLHSCNLF